jgi:hypothetical protein
LLAGKILPRYATTGLGPPRTRIRIDTNMAMLSAFQTMPLMNANP